MAWRPSQAIPRSSLSLAAALLSTILTVARPALADDSGCSLGAPYQQPLDLDTQATADCQLGQGSEAVARSAGPLVSASATSASQDLAADAARGSTWVRGSRGQLIVPKNDHGLFFLKNSRYKAATAVRDDPRQVAYEINRAG